MKVGIQNLAKSGADQVLLSGLDLMGESDRHLVDCPNEKIKINMHILTALIDLIEKAKSAGFDLRVASGFRSFDRQLFIWNSKANGVRPVLDESGCPIDLSQLNDDEKVYAILRWSALPGASRHHWGTDIDVYDASRMLENYQLQLTVEETESGGPFAEFHQWLSQELSDNSQNFFRPYVAGVGSVSPEPWHLSYAPLAGLYASALTQNILREKIEATDIALKESILKNLNNIYQNYIEPYQG